MLIVPLVHLLLKLSSFHFKVAWDIEECTEILGRRQLAACQPNHQPAKSGVPAHDEMQASGVMLLQVPSRPARAAVATSSHPQLQAFEFDVHLDDGLHRGEHGSVHGTKGRFVSLFTYTKEGRYPM